MPGESCRTPKAFVNATEPTAARRRVTRTLTGHLLANSSENRPATPGNRHRADTPTLVCLPRSNQHRPRASPKRPGRRIPGTAVRRAAGARRRHGDRPRRIAALRSRRGRARRRRLRVRPSRHPGTALSRQRPPAQRLRAHRLDLGQRHRTRRPRPTIFQRPLRSATEATPVRRARSTVAANRPGPPQAPRQRVRDTGKVPGNASGPIHHGHRLTNGRPAASNAGPGRGERWQTSPHDTPPARNRA